MGKMFAKYPHKGCICVGCSIRMEFLFTHHPVEIRVVLHVHGLPANKAREPNYGAIRHLLSIELSKLCEPVDQEVQ